MSRPDQETEVTANPVGERANAPGAEFSGRAAVSPAAPLLMGVKLPIRVLMGHTVLTLREIARLGSGSVVELDCSPDDPVEIMVNDRVIAHGEIVVVAGNYGVRITQIAPRDQAPGPAVSGMDLLGLSERLK
jgi:flagellar motor switch protein FliN